MVFLGCVKMVSNLKFGTIDTRAYVMDPDFFFFPPKITTAENIKKNLNFYHILISYFDYDTFYGRSLCFSKLLWLIIAIIY